VYAVYGTLMLLYVIKLMVVPHNIVCAVLVFIVEVQSNILTNTCKVRSLHFTDVAIMLQTANKIKQNFLPQKNIPHVTKCLHKISLAVNNKKRNIFLESKGDRRKVRSYMEIISKISWGQPYIMQEVKPLFTCIIKY